jgi:uncharacterized protein
MQEQQETFIWNKHFVHRLEDGRVLITVPHGDWVVLPEKQYSQIRTGDITSNPALFSLLECKGILLNDSNMGRITQVYKQRYENLFHGIGLHIITPTLRCNHSCIYCHARSVPIDTKGYDMDEETAKAVVDVIFQTPEKHITIEFQGGEPLANFPVVQYIVDYSKQLGEKTRKVVSYYMVSNLTLMDDDVMRYLLENNVTLCTSLDGPKEVHNKNRKYLGGKGSYNDVVRWIKRINAAYTKRKSRRSVNALPTITKFSLPYAREIVDEYVKLGFTHMRARQMNNAGFASERWNEIAYTPEEYVKFWKEFVDHVFKLNSRGTFMWEEMVVFMAKRILDTHPPHYTCLGSPCGAALTQAAYDQHGNVFICDEARSFDIFSLGNVKKKTYQEIYTSSGVADTIVLTSNTGNLLCDSCEWSPYCAPCLVCTYGQQKNLVSKMALDNECKIRKAQISYVFEDVILNPKREKVLKSWMSQAKV